MPDLDSASNEIFARYFDRLVRLARQQLCQAIQRKVDGEDIALSALKSFFMRHDESLSNYENRNDIWGLLALIVRRKCIRQIERYSAQKRRLDREISIDDRVAAAIYSREPAPEMVALMRETMESTIHKRTPQHQQVLALYISGASTHEISSEAGVSERTVERVLERLRKELQDAANGSQIA